MKIKIKIIILFLSLFLMSKTSSASSLEVSAKNIVDNSTAAAMSFDTTYPIDNYKLADQYIEVIFSSTKPVWQIDVYTDNFEVSPDTEKWGYQYGGLINSSFKKGYLLPLGWKVFDSTPVSPSPGDPCTENNGWFYIKDKSDVDDPEAPGDQSWEYAQQQGYTVIVSGGIDYANLRDGIPCSSPVYLYIEGLFECVPAGDYEGTIWLDLFSQSDVLYPVISHKPLKKIGMRRNKIKIKAHITDDKQVEWAKLHYKINGGNWKEKVMVMHGNLPYNKQCYAVIEPDEITSDSEILQYCIQASDGVNTLFWEGKDRDNPVEVEITQSTKFPKVTSGKLVVEDGNPDDGEVSLYLPEGALEEPVDITIIQRNIDDPDIPEGQGLAASKRPVAVYEFKPDGLMFNKFIIMTLLYFDLEQAGVVKVQEWIKETVNETELGLFYWDGFDWRLISKNMDKEKNTISAKITHFSMYAIFPVKPLTADDYRPRERIITPATMDMVNDLKNNTSEIYGVCRRELYISLCQFCFEIFRRK